MSDDKDEDVILTFGGPPTHVSEKIPFEPSGKNFVANPHDFKELSEQKRLGRYTLTHLIGKGGMAEVFLAKQDGPAGFQKTVVVKRIRRSLSEEQKFVEMFLREARIAARLNHANVVQIFELGECEGEYFMAMEYLDGITLHRAARRSWAMERSMPMEVVLKCVADAALGLHHAHTLRGPDGRPSPLVHRDVSPDNLLLSRDGATKVLDFGIAKDAAEAEDDLVTKTGEIKGKVPYMSPEQIRGEDLDGRSDLWSLGVTAYWLLTGRRPFDGGSDHMTIDHILRQEPPPLREINPLVPPEVNRIILKLLEKDRLSRLGSGQDLHSELVQILGPAAGGGATASFAEEMMVAPKAESNLPPGQLITVVAARPVTAWLQRVQATEGTHYENMLPEPTPTSSSGMRFSNDPEHQTTSKTGDLQALREEAMPGGGKQAIIAGLGFAALAAVALVVGVNLAGGSDDAEAANDAAAALAAPPSDDAEAANDADAAPSSDEPPAEAATAGEDDADEDDAEKDDDGSASDEGAEADTDKATATAETHAKPTSRKPTRTRRRHAPAKAKAPAGTKMSVSGPRSVVWLAEDGERLGKGSGTIVVPPGDKTVTAYELQRGVKTKVAVQDSASYARLPKGRLTFRVRPWAKVFLGRSMVGTTPLDTMDVPAGTYTVRLEQDAKKTTRKVVVKPGGHAIVKVDMRDL